MFNINSSNTRYDYCLHPPDVSSVYTFGMFIDYCRKINISINYKNFNGATAC